jgi:hypothetical protein
MIGLYSTRFQEQEGGMSMELGDDATYLYERSWLHFFSNAFR